MPDTSHRLWDRYLAFLLKWNAQMNLTGICDPDEIRLRHFEDSVSLLKAADFTGKSVLDIGPGAGFPGVPLRIADPSIHLTLLEANGKKMAFLRELCRELGLDNVAYMQGRAEELAHGAARESFDIVTARGVAALRVLCEIALPFVRVGGLFLAMKDSEEEAAEPGRFGGSFLPAYLYELAPGRTHFVIKICKNTETPACYPRSWPKIRKG